MGFTFTGAASGLGFHRRPVLVALALGPLVVLEGCRNDRGPTDPQPSSPAVSLAQFANDSNPSQMALAQAIPGFGGYFLDPSGTPTVYLADPADRPSAEQALAAFLTSRGFTGADLRVLQASFPYTQLDTWYRVARTGALSVAGFVLGDVDEGSNRLRFRVTNSAAAAALQGVVSQAGVPAGAVIVEVGKPIITVATLRERGRPVVGGLQINFFPTPAGTPGVSLICTLGFNAERFGVRSFITNSHCSNVEGGEETPTAYYQNTRAGGAANFIATEGDDPHWSSQLNLDCPPPLQCRYSDALRADYGPGVTTSLGRIARVDEVTTTLADTIHTIAGEWRIRAQRADPVQGEIAEKTGRTTGWTQGLTTGTCVDVLALGTNHVRLCQAVVRALVDGGDSGSPVFFRRGGSNVTLLGILWGGSTDDANPEFVYSPMSGVQRELGPLRVF